jgi:hypothetical protein
MIVCANNSRHACFEVGLIEMHDSATQLGVVADIEAFTKRFLNQKRHDY